MNKNVLIIKGSPRAEGNTATMADIFAKGAIEKQYCDRTFLIEDSIFHASEKMKVKMAVLFCV